MEIADEEASPKTGNFSSSELRSKEITTVKRKLKIDILIRLICFSSIISNYCDLNELFRLLKVYQVPKKRITNERFF